MSLWKVPLQFSFSPTPFRKKNVLEGLSGAFSWLRKPDPFSLCSLERFSSPALIVFISLPLDSFWTNRSTFFLCWKSQSWLQHRGRLSWERSRGTELFPSTCWLCFFWCRPGCGLISGLQGHMGGSCWASHQPRSSSQGCSWSILCLVYVYAWDCPIPSAGSCTWRWTSWDLHRPISQACQMGVLFPCREDMHFP